MNKQEELKLQITEDDVNIAIRFAEEIKEFVVNTCATHEVQTLLLILRP